MTTPKSIHEEYCNVYLEFHLSLTRGVGGGRGGRAVGACQTFGENRYTIVV